MNSANLPSTDLNTVLQILHCDAEKKYKTNEHNNVIKNDENLWKIQGVETIHVACNLYVKNEYFYR